MANPPIKTAVDKPAKESAAESRARAEARIRELRGNPDLQGAERDRYYAPEPPEGWIYQWCRVAVMGQPDIDAVRNNDLTGWTPVPLSRHPELMPRNWQGETIDIGGLQLMERPKVLSDEAREADRRSAREAVLVKEAQMREGRGGDLGPRKVNRFSKSHESIDVPNE